VKRCRKGIPVGKEKRRGAGGVIGLDWLGKTFGIPKPQEGEETLGEKAETLKTETLNRRRGNAGDGREVTGDDLNKEPEAWERRRQTGSPKGDEAGSRRNQRRKKGTGDGKDEELKAGDAQGHEFRGNQWTDAPRLLSRLFAKINCL